MRDIFDCKLSSFCSHFTNNAATFVQRIVFSAESSFTYDDEGDADTDDADIAIGVNDGISS